MGVNKVGYGVVLLMVTSVVSGSDPPICPRANPPANCSSTEAHQGEAFFIVDGTELTINFLKGNYLHLFCNKKINLESRSMPHFVQPTEFIRVTIDKCSTPAGSYDTVLKRLNVKVSSKMALYMKDNQSFTSQNFAGLSMQTLEIHAPFSSQLLKSTDLTKLDNVTNLALWNVALPTSTLMKLPSSLIALSIYSNEAINLQGDMFQRLDKLKYLKVKDEKMTVTPNISTSISLQSVDLHASVAKLPSLRGLVNVTIVKARDEYPINVDECDQLQHYSISHSMLKVIPDEWLANCTKLDTLVLSNLHLERLPKKLVNAGNSLRKLTISGCPLLKELTKDFFYNMNNLRELTLSNNSLTVLQPGTFTSLLSLEHLDLSSNRLTSINVGDELQPLSQLKWLSLANNPLGDLCNDGLHSFAFTRPSNISELSQLETLYLRRTHLTHLCPDWRRHMTRLQILDLAYNNISEIEFKDTQFVRAANTNSTVVLTGNPVDFIFNRRDYEEEVAKRARLIPQDEHREQITVEFQSEITCDCTAYWFARLQCEDEGKNARVRGVRCRGEKRLPLCEVPLEAMTCPLGECAPSCECRLRLTDNATLATCSWGAAEMPGALPEYPSSSLLLWAERGNLTRLPKAPALVELHLASNSIRHITADDIGRNLTVLDLRHNKIERVDADTTSALFSVPNRSIFLADNPLSCECDDLPFLEALQTRRIQVADYGQLKCADEQSVREVAVERLCEGSSGTVSAVAASALVLGVAAAAVLALLARRMACIKSFLRVRWRKEAADETKRYDVFVSFSHGDSAFVTDTLMPWLESGPRPYRVCVHYRDWGPGQWIPAHIAASVRDSRCTVAVVSHNFAESEWARMEFRAAQAAALQDAARLVAVVLDARESRAALDADLRDYLEANTYLEWGDRWFWDKLRAALPPPSGLKPATEPRVETIRTEPVVALSPAAAL